MKKILKRNSSIFSKFNKKIYMLYVHLIWKKKRKNGQYSRKSHINTTKHLNEEKIVFIKKSSK